jgi:hypothetical protein
MRPRMPAKSRDYSDTWAIVLASARQRSAAATINSFRVVRDGMWLRHGKNGVAELSSESVGALQHTLAANVRRSRNALGLLPAFVTERRRNAPTWGLTPRRPDGNVIAWLRPRHRLTIDRKAGRGKCFLHFLWSVLPKQEEP